MAAPQASYGIAITADDKTAKGAKSAEKRLGLIPKHASAASDAWARASERSAFRSSRATLRTLGAVEQAAARAFGGRSITAGFALRMGAVKEAAAAAGTGIGEAAVAGTALEGALTAVGVAGAATIGVLAAAGYAAFKFADGWAKGAASIGRTSDIIGVASKQLQEFNAAAERQGVDRATSTSAAGGLSQSLNDARYGRNSDAVALLNRMGVKLQLNGDGTVNTGAMLPVIADAIARQNSSGRRTAARILGIPDAAIPAFMQGGKALSAAMSSADSTAYVASDADIANAKRIVGKVAMVSQLKDRAMGIAGRAAAGATEQGYDAAIGTGDAIARGDFGRIVHSDFAPAAAKIARAGDTMLGAASLLISGRADAATIQGGRMGRSEIVAEAARGERLRAKFEAMGLSREEAAAWAANAVAESGGDYRRKQPGGVGYGLFQWGSHDPKKDRRRDFEKLFGHSIYQSTEDEQIRFWASERANKYAGPERHVQAAHGAAAKAAAVTKYYEGPAKLDRDSVDRARIASEIIRQVEAIPVKVEVTIPHAPPGSRARAQVGRGSQPMVSHATVGR